MNETLYNLMVVASQEADALIASGMPKQEAVRVSTEALADLVRAHGGIEKFHGLGQAIDIPDAPEIVKQVQQKISPWLWVLSVFGFGMALLNTHRISKIYGGWRAGKRAVREGRVPR
ncbi:MAG: hypothetical protein U0236_21325 [Nitrospira sp.]